MSCMKLSGNCKDATMSIRMTSKEKDRIKKKAKKEGKTASTYVTESAIAGLEKNSSRIKKSLAQMVKNQEIFNSFFEEMKEKKILDSDELYQNLIELMEGENRLWECLCR